MLLFTCFVSDVLGWILAANIIIILASFPFLAFTYHMFAWGMFCLLCCIFNRGNTVSLFSLFFFLHRNCRKQLCIYFNNKNLFVFIVFKLADCGLTVKFLQFIEYFTKHFDEIKLLNQIDEIDSNRHYGK